MASEPIIPNEDVTTPPDHRPPVGSPTEVPAEPVSDDVEGE